MKYQLCGPVTGIPRDEAVAAFEDAEAWLIERDPYADVLVPTSVVEEDATHERAMRICLGWLLNYADTLVTIPGWETSRGASLEVAVARAIGKPVMTLEEALR